ncbi:MAG: protein kinase, partial [Oscillospiraceae bacterium]|nr:protein kinase [Oscillospiraceae bacterium]
FLAFGLALYFLLSNSILNCTGIDKKSVVIKQKFNQLEKNSPKIKKNFCLFFGLPLSLFTILKFIFFSSKKVVDDVPKISTELENDFSKDQLYYEDDPQMNDNQQDNFPQPLNSNQPQISPNQPYFHQSSQPLNLQMNSRACFIFGKRLGKGNFGEVYEVTRRADNQKFCLKVEQILNENHFSELQKETEILTNLNHPNIVKCFGGFRENNLYYIILELVEGKCFEEYFKSGSQIRFGYILNLFFQLLSAVWYCHNANVIHRDIKLTNVMLDQKSNLVKLLDFGVSKKLLTDQHFTATIVGTPLCYAPEILSSQPYNSSVDIWALGVMFYTMISEGRMPYVAWSIPELAYVIKTTNFTPLAALSTKKKFSDELSYKLSELINGMLDKEPKTRWKISDVISAVLYIAERCGFLVNGQWQLDKMNNYSVILNYR